MFFPLGLTPSFLAASGFAARLLRFRAVTLQRKIRDCSQSIRSLPASSFSLFFLINDMFAVYIRLATGSPCTNEMIDVEDC